MDHWSVVISIPINALATLIVTNIPPPAPPLTPAGLHVAVAMTVGLAAD